MTMDALQAKVNVTTQSDTILTLDNGSILTGNVAGDSSGGGLYATWFDNDGYYVDGVIKFNRFSNELHT